MEITLTNFRCHEIPTTFNFPEYGLALLSASSGRGKSSILDAIQFVLYGIGTKITTWNQKKSKVELKYKELTIIRTKGPNKLILINKENEEYNDDTAQEIINNIFGTNFAATSYINQKGLGSFFSLTPSDKISFLESIAMGHTNVLELKKACKVKIKERRDILNQKVGETRIIKEDFYKRKEPVEIVFPLGPKYSEKKIENESKKWKNNTIQLKTLRKDLSILKEAKSANDLKIQKSNYLNTNIIDLTKQLKDISNQLEELKCNVNIKQIEQQIFTIKNHKELSSLKIAYVNELKDWKAECVKERAQLEEDLDTLKEIPIIEGDPEDIKKNIKIKERTIKLKAKIKEIEKDLKDIPTLDDHINKLNALTETEQSLMKELHVVQDQKVVRKCPSCNCYLRLDGNNLKLTEGFKPSGKSEQDIQKELSVIRKEKKEYDESKQYLYERISANNKYTQELKSLPIINMDIDYEKQLDKLTNSLSEQLRRKEQIIRIERQLKNKEYSNSVQNIRRRLDLKESTIKQLEKSLEGCELPSENIESLQEQITSAKILQEKSVMLNKQYLSLQIKINSLQTELENINISTIDYTSQIKEAQISITSLELLEEEFKIRNNEIQKYMEYRREYESYKSRKEDLDNAMMSEKNATISLSIAEKCLKKILETESAVVISIIDNINGHMNYYLEKFFTDPIIVEITSFKETKSGDIKPSVDIKVSYKGADSDINCLSGGERARVELAICLSINNVVGSKLLLLDEVLANLNTEVIEDITTVLRQEAHDQRKLIINIAHQSNEADYDFIKTLE
jgi:exonuclease SbcC